MWPLQPSMGDSLISFPLSHAFPYLALAASALVSWLCRSSSKAMNSFQPQSLCTCGSSFLPEKVSHCLVNCCCCLITKSCPPVCDSMDCSPPGSSAPWDSSIFFSRGSSQPRDQTQVSCISCTGRWPLSHQGSHVNISN